MFGKFYHPDHNLYSVSITSHVYYTPISSWVMSLSRLRETLLSSSLVMISWERRSLNCLRGCSKAHCWCSTDLQSVSSRDAMTGRPLRSTISNKPRSILPEFCETEAHNVFNKWVHATYTTLITYGVSNYIARGSQAGYLCAISDGLLGACSTPKKLLFSDDVTGSQLLVLHTQKFNLS